MSVTTKPRRVAFLGLGVMGYPMAGHLAGAGHRVHVYNRTAATAQRFVEEHGGTAKASAAEAVAGCDAIFSCLGDDRSVREVLLGDEGAFAAARRGALFVDHTTASATLARELADIGREHGLYIVDAPVSGGEVGAQTGKLSIMAGGEAGAFDRAHEIWTCYAKSATHIGPAGSGQQAKMVNQVCIAGVLKGLCEGIALLEATGLCAERVFEAIGGGAAQSWQMNNRATTMVRREFDFGFAVHWMRKDLGLALDEARGHGVDLPLAEQVNEEYAVVESLGGTRFDTSSLLLAQDEKGGDS